MTNYAQHLTPRSVPQTQPLVGMVPNDAGGYGYPVSDWTLLDRFLILGAEGGTYYTSEPVLTREVAQGVARCLDADALRVVTRVVEISRDGRAAKNDPALFVLALALCHTAARPHAYVALPLVARTGTHLFHLLAMTKALGRGWSRGLQTAVRAWYQAQSDVAYSVLKYPSRDGWSHRDVLRLAHVKPWDDASTITLRYAAGKFAAEEPTWHETIDAVRRLHAGGVAETEVCALIQQYRLAREMIPSEWLTKPAVWHALLPHMGLTAIIRNLGTLSKLGVLAPGSLTTRGVGQMLTDAERLRKARVHPAALLLAMMTYRQGHGTRSAATWPVVPQILDALSEGFHAAFRAVEPTGLRTLVAVDTSGSMSASILGGTLSCWHAGVAMALATLASEPQATVVSFDTVTRPTALSPKQRLDDALRSFPHATGGTDVAAPIRWAMAQRLPVDLFVLYTDEQTWAGPEHVMSALQAYRQMVGINAKLAVACMQASRTTVLDASDAGVLTLAGFDPTTPQAIGAFARGFAQ